MKLGDVFVKVSRCSDFIKYSSVKRGGKITTEVVNKYF